MIPKIIAVDFDGTCVTHEFPNVGKDVGAAPVLRALVDQGHKIILYTMRSGHRPDHPHDFLAEAILWFHDQGIELYGINQNPQQHKWTSSLKPYAHIYIDDAALGCPLVHDLNLSDRPFVNWDKVEQILIQKGYLPGNDNQSP